MLFAGRTLHYFSTISINDRPKVGVHCEASRTLTSFLLIFSTRFQDFSLITRFWHIKDAALHLGRLECKR